jgi:hypothetical protein
MKLWHFLTDWLDSESSASADITDPFREFDVNPANGLPMIDSAGIDIEGNPFGTDSHAFDADSTTCTGFDDCNNLSIFD